MANYITDQGICLRVTDFSETSQIVGMFTRDHGLVPLIAKGAKRSSKKSVMSGPLDLLTSGEVVFVPGKETPGGGNVQLGTLAEWELADHRRALRGNLAGLNAAMMCAEVTTHLMHPLDPHAELFDELEAALDLLGRANQTGRVLLAYVKAALLAAGYWPQLQNCLACGRPPGNGMMRFNARAGGVFCGTSNGDANADGVDAAGCHASVGGTTIQVPGKIVLALDRLALPAALRAAPPERAANETALLTALQLLLTQIEIVTDKGVRTRELLKSIFPH